jgi:2-polyprenyl-3-methyl-5-hydroxy-6-metoxy-1,4-benzoquinol methylase
VSQAVVSVSLREQRMHAAQISRGTSAAPIYQAATALARSLDLSGDLLEFGAGTGNFLATLTANGFAGQITGADLLPRPRDISPSVTWVLADLNEPLPLPAESFDAIVSTEVIEHLENPRAAFREFHRLLRAGGHLLISTPNQESIRSLASLVVRGHFVAFLDSSYPAHLTALLRLDLQRLCAEAGFAAPRFFFTDDGAIPMLTSLRWQTISLGLLRGRLFSDNLLLATTKLG